MMAFVKHRMPALLLALLLLMLQAMHGVRPCCQGEDCHETHVHAADLRGDALESVVGVCPSHGEEHPDDRGACTCVCHATVAAVSGQVALGDATVVLLPYIRPQVVLPLGHHLTSKPPPRA